jgi:hypothetical protein
MRYEQATPGCTLLHGRWEYGCVTVVETRPRLITHLWHFAFSYACAHTKNIQCLRTCVNGVCHGAAGTVEIYKWTGT